jgi:hypothetical protein
MRHARDTHRKPIEQKDARGVLRCCGNGGIRRFQKVAKQDGFGGVCHTPHAARVPFRVKHHGALRRFVLR